MDLQHTARKKKKKTRAVTWIDYGIDTDRILRHLILNKSCAAVLI
jgi:hypothetical protein